MMKQPLSVSVVLPEIVSGLKVLETTGLNNVGEEILKWFAFEKSHKLQS